MTSEQESHEQPKEQNLSIESDYAAFVPGDFKRDPFKYVEEQGINIKEGRRKVDATGYVREDPGAVKELPAWQDFAGNELVAVAKKVNVRKGEVGASGDPFHEYEILQKLAEAKLPAARPIAKYSEDDQYLFVMEKISGVPALKKSLVEARNRGWNEADVERVIDEAGVKMTQLKGEYARAGFEREWKLSDMVLQINYETKRLDSIVPTDWERTKYTGSQLS